MTDSLGIFANRNDDFEVDIAGGKKHCNGCYLAAAMLIYIAKGGGEIESRESGTMLELLEAHCALTGAEALDLLSTVMSDLADDPKLAPALAIAARSLPDTQKEDLAYMALQVIAADGRRDVAEMQQFNTAVEAVGIAPEVVHRAFDRFFSETMPDTGD